MGRRLVVLVGFAVILGLNGPPAVLASGCNPTCSDFNLQNYGCEWPTEDCDLIKQEHSSECAEAADPACQGCDWTRMCDWVECSVGHSPVNCYRK
jgi:hypothetical protein